MTAGTTTGAALPPPTTGAEDGALHSHLRPADVLRLAGVGLRARRLRVALAALGICIGIASMMSVLGITRSSQADLLAQLDRLGTNLLTVENGRTLGGEAARLPQTAPGMIARIPPVQQVAATAALPGLTVRRSDRIPASRSGGLSVRATDTNLLTALGSTVHRGTDLNAATANYPATVLGFGAAQTLGIATLDVPVQVWLGERWFRVVGILAPLPLAPEIDRAALIGFPIAQQLFGFDGSPTKIYVRTDPQQVIPVREVLNRTAFPQHPDRVQVSRPSDALAARVAVQDASTSLFLGLGAVALLVGGVGIANVMVIAILERRREIGLRRALGATRIHVATQFVAESILLATLGGTAGVLLGSIITVGYALSRQWTPVIPGPAVAGGLALAVLVGAVAGLYPAMRAASLSPTEALRTI
ncbi:MAG TPA: ABC transporter permease [Chloroflexota bacterium]|nr:ABC transporter permease [Chloroflexota bacterium]